MLRMGYGNGHDARDTCDLLDRAGRLSFDTVRKLPLPALDRDFAYRLLHGKLLFIPYVLGMAQCPLCSAPGAFLPNDHPTRGCVFAEAVHQSVAGHFVRLVPGVGRALFDEAWNFDLTPATPAGVVAALLAILAKRLVYVEMRMRTLRPPRGPDVVFRQVRASFRSHVFVCRRSAQDEAERFRLRATDEQLQRRAADPPPVSWLSTLLRGDALDPWPD
jgi:hypothetical protein